MSVKYRPLEEHEKILITDEYSCDRNAEDGWREVSRIWGCCDGLAQSAYNTTRFRRKIEEPKDQKPRAPKKKIISLQLESKWRLA